MTHQRNSALLVAILLTAAISQSQSIDIALARQAPVAATSATVVPMLVRYDGVAAAGSGEGAASMTFLIFKDQTGGDPLWIETQSVAPDAAGKYEIYLGSTYSSGLPANLFGTGEARWLEVQIAGETPGPRTLLTSVPYALKAADAATLGGLPASAFALAGTPTAPAPVKADGITSDGVSNVTTTGGTNFYVPRFNGASTITNSEIYDTGTSVGIGNVPNAGAKLDVNGSMIMRGNMTVSRTGNATSSKGYSSYGFDFFSNVYNSSTKAVDNPYFQLQSEPTGNNTASPSATFNLLFANNGSAAAETGFYINPDGTIHFASGQTFTPTSSSGVAVDGTSSSGTGVEGTSSSGYGVQGTSNTAPGVYGLTGGGTNNTAGVYGRAGTGNSSGFTGIAGVWGDASAHVGVFGTSDQYPGVQGESATGYGVQGNSTSSYGILGVTGAGSGAAAGVYGYSSSSVPGVKGASASGNGGEFYGGGNGNGLVAVGAGSGYGIEALTTANHGQAIYANAQGVDSVAIYGISNGGVDAGNVSIGVAGSAYSYGVSGFASGGAGVQGTYQSQSNTGNGLVNLGVLLAGVWGDSGADLDNSDGSLLGAVLGTADNNFAGDFENNSSKAATMIIRNDGNGPITNIADVLQASGSNGMCGIGNHGDISCTGQVKTLSTTRSARTVETYAMQSPENWMEDFGSATLQSGAATVSIDAAFAQIVSGSADYRVFLTPNGDSKGLYVFAKTPTSFEVRESGGGASTLAFDYRIVAKRKGFETQRMVDVTDAMKAVNTRNSQRYAKSTTPPHTATRPPIDPRRFAVPTQKPQ